MRNITVTGPTNVSSEDYSGSHNTSGTARLTFTEEGYCLDLSMNCVCYFVKDPNGRYSTEIYDYGGSYGSVKLYDESGKLLKDFGSAQNNSGHAILSIGTLYVYPGDYLEITYSHWGKTSVGQYYNQVHAVSGRMMTFNFSE